MIKLRPSKSSDVKHLAKTIRTICSDEIYAVNTALTPELLLKASLDSSKETFSIIKDGKCVAMLGYNELPEKTALVWLVTSEEILAMPITLVKILRKCFSYLKKEHNEIVGYIKSSVIKSMGRWYKWLGFEVIEEDVAIGNGSFAKIIYRG